MQVQRFVDSHTEGEPTRVLLAPDGGLFPETLPEVLARWTDPAVGRLVIPPEMLALAANPRAADATVCALVCRPAQAGELCGVLFWNAAAPLGMCGHATIGLVKTLERVLGATHGPTTARGMLRRARIATRVGAVSVELLDDGRVAFENVPARVHARDVEVVLEQGGLARGDLAWGGNWFFLVRHDGAPGGRTPRAMRSHAGELAYARAIERGIARMGLRGGHENGGLVDHVALLFTPDRPDADARNFVLCPNGTYDRSPCGTGTSALLAALAARGELAPGETWRQESAIGSLFEATYRIDPADPTAAVRPRIVGRAFVVAEGALVDDAADPSRAGAWRESSR